MNRRIKIIIIMVLIISFLILLTGCKKNQDQKGELKEKINVEISYLDSELTYMINALNNINYAKYRVIQEEVESTAGVNKRWRKGRYESAGK